MVFVLRREDTQDLLHLRPQARLSFKFTLMGSTASVRGDAPDGAGFDQLYDFFTPGMRVSVTILDAAIVASPPAKKKRGVARHHVTSEEDVQAANLKKSMGLEVAFSSSSSFVIF